MAEHFIKYCKVCGKVMKQCRCPAKDKTIYYGVCDECKETNKNTDSNPNIDI